MFFLTKIINLQLYNPIKKVMNVSVSKVFFILFFNPFLFKLFSQLNFTDTAKLHLLSEKNVFINEFANSLNEELFTSSELMNFNQKFSLSKDLFLKNRRVFSNQGTIYLVFKTINGEKAKLLELYRRGVDFVISTNEISSSFSEKKILLNNSDLGLVVNSDFLFSNLSKSQKGKLVLNDELNNCNIYEVLFFDRLISSNEKEILDSYFSIKYGISLNENSNYYDGLHNLIWDSKNNSTFNNRVTGFGIDYKTKLYRNTSMNSDLKNSIIVKTNELQFENENPLSQEFYLMWGDNNGELNFKIQHGFELFDRHWKIINEKLKDDVTIYVSPELFFGIQKTDALKLKDIQLLIYEQEGDLDLKKVKTVHGKLTETGLLEFKLLDLKKISYFTFTKSNVNSYEDEAFILGEKNEIKLFPNPITSDQSFNIQFDLDIERDLSVNYYDVSGKLIKQYFLKSVKFLNHIDTINTSGIFLIRIEGQGLKKEFKLVIR